MSRVIAHFKTSSDYYRTGDNPALDETELSRRVMRNMFSDPEPSDSYARYGNYPTFEKREYVEALEILLRGNASLRESITRFVNHCYPLETWSAKFKEAA